MNKASEKILEQYNDYREAGYRWYEIQYTYQYGNENWESTDMNEDVLAQTREEALANFYEDKNDNFQKRVLSLSAHAK